MKSLPSAFGFLAEPRQRRNLATLAKLLSVLVCLVVIFVTVFQLLMFREGQQHSLATAVYWVFVVMSTLGFGDITFHSDAGRLFSVVVLLTGSIFMLVLMPFMFIQFFYVPWMEAREASRAPRKLPISWRRHVILTGLSAVERSLAQMLSRANIPYVLIVSDLNEALRLHDEGYPVMIGELDDQQTYHNARTENAVLVVATQRDTTNTNIAFTVREISSQVTIAATASAPASVDILELAGCNQVLQLGRMLGTALARNVLGRDCRCHIVGQFGELFIAETAAFGTPLIGRTLKEIRLAQHARVNVIGVWNRGRFELAGPTTKIEAASVLLLAGTRADLQEYDELFCIYGSPKTSVIIIGGGRVGRTVAEIFLKQGVEYRIIERLPERVRDKSRYVQGDAAELEVLEEAGIYDCSAVVITTHDDDINVYLTIYCRRLRQDVQILSRANQDRNVSTLHRAGADFVLSYASTGASCLFNMLRKESLLSIADGLDAFRVRVPPHMIGKTLGESQFRQSTGCNVIAIEDNGVCNTRLTSDTVLNDSAQLIVVGDADAGHKLFETNSSGSY